uniref:Uncharacterized protein n=1 Tax=Phlebotomus papatasi TaxID=29031 RepID=A0A1B0DNH4_PHLPP
MMKRRWSNNGGFALRMLEESSSEVTSSSAALVMSPGMTMSPTSLGSPEYSELELWSYDENAYHHHGVIAAGANTGVWSTKSQYSDPIALDHHHDQSYTAQ